MAVLKITRKSHYSNYFRNIRLFLDDRFLYSISDGETKEFDIKEGEHSIEARIDWTSSNKIIFNSNVNETITLELGANILNNKMSILLSVLRFLLIVFASIISIHYNNYFIFWITVLLLVMWYGWEIVRRKGTSIVFYMTAGRREYLYLKHL